MGKSADFSFVRDLVRHTYSDTGAPSVDPTVVFEMALLGYLYGISSERQLAREIRLNLAYLWFLGYDLDKIPPDHSVLSKTRARYGPQTYRQFFFEIVRRCREERLIRGDRLYLDASLARADASIDSLVTRPLYHQLADVDDYVHRLWSENETLKESGGKDADPASPPPSPPSDTGRPERLTPNERSHTPEAAIIPDRLKGHRSELRMPKLLRFHGVFDLVLVDELGYVPFSREAAQLLFEFFSDRYQTRATARSHVLVLNGESYRMRESRRRATPRRAGPEPPEGEARSSMTTNLREDAGLPGYPWAQVRQVVLGVPLVCRPSLTGSGVVNPSPVRLTPARFWRGMEDFIAPEEHIYRRASAVRPRTFPGLGPAERRAGGHANAGGQAGRRRDPENPRLRGPA